MIQVTINGHTRELPGEMPLPEVVKLLDIAHPRIAVALNGTVLRADEHDETVVRAGDTLEIVRMVGGG